MLQTPFCDGAELRQRPLSFSTTARPRIDMLGSRPFIGDDSSRRECDDSLDHDDVGPSLLAFLENVASMSADCSTAHDLSKIKARAAELSGVLHKVLQLSETNPGSCHCFSTKITTMPETRSHPAMDHRQLSLPPNFQLWVKQVLTSDSNAHQPQKSKMITYCDDVYNLYDGAKNRRRRIAKKSMTASSLLYMVVPDRRTNTKRNITGGSSLLIHMVPSMPLPTVGASSSVEEESPDAYDSRTSLSSGSIPSSGSKDPGPNVTDARITDLTDDTRCSCLSLSEVATTAEHLESTSDSGDDNAAGDVCERAFAGSPDILVVSETASIKPTGILLPLDGRSRPCATGIRTSCPHELRILKPIAVNGPFELRRAGSYLEKPSSAKAKVYLLRNAGALPSSNVSSALSLEACTNGWPLTTVCMWIFQVHDVLGPMCIKPQTMQQYLLRIEAGYLAQNAYHNRAHAADVTLQMYALLQNCFQLSTMPHQAACSLLLTSTLAAAVHDFMHPGSNNQFQAEIDSVASLIYNGKSIIENFSISSALNIARSMGLFSDMPRSSAKQICKDIVDIVLASDMVNHFDVLSSFKSTVSSTKGSKGNGSPGTEATARLFCDIHLEKRETRMAVLKLAIQIADLGHCYLPWAEHVEWVERLEEEFFTQGDIERMETSMISPMMDRSEPGVGDHGNSVGFYKLFVMPMLEAWTKVFPSCSPMLEQARSNMEHHLSNDVANRA